MPRAFGLVLQAVAAFTFLETINSNVARYPLSAIRYPLSAIR